MKLSDKQIELFIKSLVHDDTISNYEWENKYQHLRNDLSEGIMSLNDLHMFHSKRNGIDVIGLFKKYDIINKVFYMDLREFFENKFECKIELSDDDLSDFLNSYDCYFYDKNSIREELCDYWEIGDWLLDFINLKEFSEYSNYTCVNDNLYICNNGLHSFENAYVSYGKNMENMIKDFMGENLC